VRAADHYSSACMQAPPSTYSRGLTNRSEDCLHFNVWTPVGSAGKRLPVLVWICGGTAGLTAEPIYDGNDSNRPCKLAYALRIEI
jgi:para-nitrobenzyl esterase